MAGNMRTKSNAVVLYLNYVKVTNVNVFNIYMIDHVFCILYI